MPLVFIRSFYSNFQYIPIIFILTHTSIFQAFNYCPYRLCRERPLEPIVFISPHIP